MPEAKRRPGSDETAPSDLGDRTIANRFGETEQAQPFGIIANRVVNDVARRCTVERIAYKVVVSDCPFSAKIYVSVEPHLPTRPPVEFRSGREALVFADELGRIEGWKVVDRREFSE